MGEALRFLTSGYQMDVHRIVNGALYEVKYDEMVVVNQSIRARQTGDGRGQGSQETKPGNNQAQRPGSSIGMANQYEHLLRR